MSPGQFEDKWKISRKDTDKLKTFDGDMSLYVDWKDRMIDHIASSNSEWRELRVTMLSPAIRTSYFVPMTSSNGTEGNTLAGNSRKTFGASSLAPSA